MPEVLITLAILAIICSFALFSGQQSVNNNYLTSSTEQLAADIRNLQFQALENNTTQTCQLKLAETYYQLLTNNVVIKTQPLPQTLKLSNNNGTLPLTLSFDAKNLTNNTPYIITITDNTSNKSQHIILAKTTHRIRISNESNPTYKSEEN